MMEKDDDSFVKIIHDENDDLPCSNFDISSIYTVDEDPDINEFVFVSIRMEQNQSNQNIQKNKKEVTYGHATNKYKHHHLSTSKGRYVSFNSSSQEHQPGRMIKLLDRNCESEKNSIHKLDMLDIDHTILKLSKKKQENFSEGNPNQLCQKSKLMEKKSFESASSLTSYFEIVTLHTSLEEPRIDNEIKVEVSDKTKIIQKSKSFLPESAFHLPDPRRESITQSIFEYLDQVKLQIGGQLPKYDEFLLIIEKFKTHTIDMPSFFQRVNHLFRGQNKLMPGFNNFLSELQVHSVSRTRKTSNNDKKRSRRKSSKNTRSRLRLLSDFRTIQNNPASDLSAVPIESNIMHWEGLIFGTTGSLWEGGIFKIFLTFTEEYPFKAPAVYFITEIFHPNISPCGKISLEDKWSPAYDVMFILRLIQSILCNPKGNRNINNNEANRLFQEDRVEYNRRARQVVNQSLIFE